MVDLGETLYFAEGSDKNIKITTADDFELFKALLNIKKSSWMK
jgi:2-C-methyl-D-erythritol 4-phosphate cytidylyltransferase